MRVIQKAGCTISCLAADKSKQCVFFGYEEFDNKLDLESGSQQQFKVHGGYSVRSIHLADNGNTIITCGDDRTVAAFDSETFAEKWRYQCSNQACSLAIIENEVFVGVYYSVVVVLDVLTGELMRTFDQICRGFVFVAVTPQGCSFFVKCVALSHFDCCCCSFLYVAIQIR